MEEGDKSQAYKMKVYVNFRTQAKARTRLARRQIARLINAYMNDDDHTQSALLQEYGLMDEVGEWLAAPPSATSSPAPSAVADEQAVANANASANSSSASPAPASPPHVPRIVMGH